MYRAAVSLAEDARLNENPEKRDEKRVIEVTDDIQKASLKAEPITAENTGVIIKDDVPKVEGKEKEYEKEQKGVGAAHPYQSVRQTECEVYGHE